MAAIRNTAKASAHPLAAFRPSHLDTLTQRRNWLKQRIKAKRAVKWETEYDEREYAALVWAIKHLEEIS